MTKEGAKLFLDSTILLVGERLLLDLKTKLVGERRKGRGRDGSLENKKLYMQYEAIVRVISGERDEVRPELGYVFIESYVRTNRDG